jgi:hypothetical protein
MKENLIKAQKGGFLNEEICDKLLKDKMDIWVRIIEETKCPS